MDTIPKFPSANHCRTLSDRVSSKKRSGLTGQKIPDDLKGWDSLSPEEQRHWHAYKYAFRCLFLFMPGPCYPADPDGQFYDPVLIGQATAAYPERLAALERKMPAMRYRFRVAAAYRWMYDRGTPMPSGVPENSPIVAELLEIYEGNQWLGDFAERLPAPVWPPGKGPEHTVPNRPLKNHSLRMPESVKSLDSR